MLLTRLAEHCASQRNVSLPTQVEHAAKRAMVDWFAAAIPGMRAEPAQALARTLAHELGHGPCSLIPDGRRAPPRVAALLHGTAAHTLEVDDIHRDSILHPGAPTIAAALAVAEAKQASGAAVLVAVTLGYEVAARIGVALGRSHYRHFHTTGTVGGFGAAAATAALLRLSAQQTADALATVATFAAGLQQAFEGESMSKPLHAGRAAEAGTLAALAAAEGVRGAPTVLEGDRGMGSAMAEQPDWSRASSGLGDTHSILDVTIKNHPCCGHTFAAIDAVLELRARERIAVGEIEEVVVETYATALEVAGRRDPVTPAAAKFSLPFVVATALVHGRPRQSDFEDVALADAEVRALMPRISLAVDPAIDAGFPTRRAARVTIVRRDGSRTQHFQPTRKGDPDAPLSDDELETKYRGLVQPVLGVEPAAQLLGQVWRLEALDTITDLGPKLGGMT